MAALTVKSEGAISADLLDAERAVSGPLAGALLVLVALTSRAVFALTPATATWLVWWAGLFATIAGLALGWQRFMARLSADESRAGIALTRNPLPPNTFPVVERANPAPMLAGSLDRNAPPAMGSGAYATEANNGNAKRADTSAEGATSAP